MASNRSFSQIVQSMIDRLRLVQPNLDTKPGTVSRDLFIDNTADELDRLYKSVKIVSDKQSPERAIGQDLDRWARNFGISRRPGSSSNGVVVYTINELNSDIPIPNGTVATARNGTTYSTVGSFVMSVSQRNRYAATANRLRSALNLAGITDRYAIEVPASATRPGTSGNIAPLQIISSDLEDGLRVTNLTAFNGGTNTETDNSFRARIFAIFSGSNTGTASGYVNASLAIENVLDVLVVEPGNSLMLRDGTETIEINDGSFRILNSGTGGKVDLYILGRNLEEIRESFIFSDLSGVGDATDERNDLIPGLLNLDRTLTTEERRVQAFNEGQIPLQPIDSVVSLVGSSSGILAEASIDSNGDIIGNFELKKDTNPSTGGSPFGFDKIHFISNTKRVTGESITKRALNSVDALEFTDVEKFDRVYQDIQITNENSSRSKTDRSVIVLNHKPVTSVSRVSNSTTGETYVVENQNISSISGVNETGEIVISGKTLPSTADILSVDYTWRKEFDKYIDYNGESSPSVFKDDSVADSIDWGVPNGIRKEVSVISKTEDGFEFTVNTVYNINRVTSVYIANNIERQVVSLENINSQFLKTIVLNSSDESINNIVSIKNSNGVEVYNTENNDGTFSGRTIYLPTDTAAVIGDSVFIEYNKTELFDIDNGNGSFSSNTITLPSEDILRGEDLFDLVEDSFLADSDIYIDYVAEIEDVVRSTSLSSLPINGSSSSNVLFDSNLAEISGSNQPVFFETDNFLNLNSIKRFSPSNIAIEVSGIIRPGRIKVSGTTLERVELVLTAGLVKNELKFSLESALKEFYNINSIPSSIYIARVDEVKVVDTEEKFDIIGYSLNENRFSYRTANIDNSLKNSDFLLPNTSINNGISLTSGQEISVSILVANTNDFENLYFPENIEVITSKKFARIGSISVSSGFRSASGALVGSISARNFTQPNDGLNYISEYNFVAPKEGERLTLRYNLNRLITDVTANIENVRNVSADVLVKEAFSISVDVEGEIVISDDIRTGSTTIRENVIDAVVNLLNTSSLGPTVDYSDVITTAASVTGVESVNISRFNESGKLGRKTAIRALDNQTIVAGSVLFKIVSRKDFRIT